MTDGDACHAVGGGATCMPEKMGLQKLAGVTTSGALDCLSDGGDNCGCTAHGCKDQPGCMVAPDVAAPAFEADAFLINLGQNECELGLCTPLRHACKLPHVRQLPLHSILMAVATRVLCTWVLTPLIMCACRRYLLRP